MPGSSPCTQPSSARTVDRRSTERSMPWVRSRFKLDRQGSWRYWTSCSWAYSPFLLSLKAHLLCAFQLAHTICHSSSAIFCIHHHSSMANSSISATVIDCSKQTVRNLRHLVALVYYWIMFHCCLKLKLEWQRWAAAAVPKPSSKSL